MSELPESIVRFTASMRSIAQSFAEMGEQAERAAQAWRVAMARAEQKQVQVVTGHDGVTRVRVR